MTERAEDQRGRAVAPAKGAQQTGGDAQTDRRAPGNPVAPKIIATNGLPRQTPRGVGRVMARERPGAIPDHVSNAIHAFTPPKTLERWNEEAAGVRAASGGDGVIEMFDVIGADDWSGGGITAKSVSARLREIGDNPVTVQINSPGGDMFEGIAIYNVLRQHSKPVTAKIVGVAASAASIIAMAADKIEIGAASFLMIHNCWVVAAGNKADFLDVAAYLEPFDKAMADVYASRSGQPASKCADWMNAETYMAGAVAIERGFADALLPADEVKIDAAKASEDRKLNDLRALEISLMSGAGLSRAAARAKIKAIRGTTDSAPHAGTTDSAGNKATDAAIAAGIAEIIASMRAAAPTKG